MSESNQYKTPEGARMKIFLNAGRSTRSPLATQIELKEKPTTLAKEMLKQMQTSHKRRKYVRKELIENSLYKPDVHFSTNPANIETSTPRITKKQLQTNQ